MNGTYILKIKLGDRRCASVEDLADLLRLAATRVEHSRLDGNLVSRDGNTVGHTEFVSTDPPALAPAPFPRERKEGTIQIAFTSGEGDQSCFSNLAWHGSFAGAQASLVKIAERNVPIRSYLKVDFEVCFNGDPKPLLRGRFDLTGTGRNDADRDLEQHVGAVVEQAAEEVQVSRREEARKLRYLLQVVKDKQS